MRATRLRGLFFGVLVLAAGLAPALADPLDDAKLLMNDRRYDEAVQVLEGVVTAGNAPAEAYFELGRAYHWKRDYENALRNYRQAAGLDKQYLTAPLPMLSHFKLYEEMIGVGEAALASGDVGVAVFSGLLNAYYDTKRQADYQRILTRLRNQAYSETYSSDYRHYLLAKAEVRAGNHDRAFDHIAAMTTKSLLQFMGTSEDFAPIASDPRFIQMTR